MYNRVNNLISKVNNKMITKNIYEEKNIHILGRTNKNTDVLTLFWTASGIEMDITASELWVEFVSDYSVMEPWISVEINGSFVSRQMITKGTHNVCIFRNMNPNVKKHVRILRETQAMSEDNDCLLQMTSISHDGTIEPIQPKKMRIEFIGDSIMSGEGIYGAKCEEDWISMFAGTANNFAVMTADNLGADFYIISQSGWGAAASWDNNPQKALPLYYEQICGVVSGKRNIELHAHDLYDFKNRAADAVVVNLGTNDEAAFWLKNGEYDGCGVKRFKTSVRDFLKKLRKYNPTAEIVWAYGMLGTGFLGYINEAVSDYKTKTGDNKVSVLILPEATEETFGSREHPGAENHREAAEVLTVYLKKILD